MRNLEVADDPRPLVRSAWLTRTLISVLSLACWALAAFSTPNHLPFTTRCGAAACEITAIRAGEAAPALRVGDRIVLAEQPFATRTVLVSENVPRERTYPWRVHRGAQVVSGELHSVRGHQANLLAARAMFTFILLFGLLMLWRGESAASQGLCLFALSLVISAGATIQPLPPPWNLLGQALSSLFGGPVAFMGLYITADALVHANTRPRAARRARRMYLGALVVLYLSEAVPPLLLVGGDVIPLLDAIQILTIAVAVVVWVVPLVYLLNGYRSALPESRLRIRWFIVSIALLVPVIVCNLLLSWGVAHDAAMTQLLQVTPVLLTIAIFSMLSYAVLSQRLVAVRFVMNRALVFGVLTASLIGVLSLTESLIERSVISREAGLARRAAAAWRIHSPPAPLG